MPSHGDQVQSPPKLRTTRQAVRLRHEALEASCEPPAATSLGTSILSVVANPAVAAAIHDLRRDKDVLEQQLADVVQRGTFCEGAFDDLKKYVSTLEERYHKLQLDYYALQQDSALLHARNLALEKQNAALQHENAHLKHENASLKGELASLRHEKVQQLRRNRNAHHERERRQKQAKAKLHMQRRELAEESARITRARVRT
ncbi:hypothetical protein K488DRAFT_92237 [Vararia minispora EC-137]|uniref:Uncharacterized protein n=1 Tax=Vararia minispora EC-137 TaxID=1314806 RepID=A0ACB8Q4B3_9AGAM|nr:hypothetical protein K488DRAFT_92237 [Vararia minispora EC-137]